MSVRPKSFSRRWIKVENNALPGDHEMTVGSTDVEIAGMTVGKREGVDHELKVSAMANDKTLVAEGDLAPDFTAIDQDGKSHTLSDYRGKQVVIFMYPRDMTPGCTTEACDFRDNLERITSVGGVVFGMSADSVASHKKFEAKHDLNYPLLVDEDHKILENYGAWVTKKMYGKEFEGIQRSTFVIDQEGVIAHAFRKVKVKGHVEEVLNVLSP